MSARKGRGGTSRKEIGRLVEVDRRSRTPVRRRPRPAAPQRVDDVRAAIPSDPPAGDGAPRPPRP
jgi:hypothetical protein